MSVKKEKLIACSRCGEDEFRRGGLKDTMLARMLCFTCLFWTMQMETVRTDAKRVIVNGEHYWASTELSDGTGGGHGGRMFYIQFLGDWGLMKSNNVWAQGTIPEDFRGDLPDNARFLTREDYEEHLDDLRQHHLFMSECYPEEIPQSQADMPEGEIKDL